MEITFNTAKRQPRVAWLILVWSTSVSDYKEAAERLHRHITQLGHSSYQLELTAISNEYALDHLNKCLNSIVQDRGSLIDSVLHIVYGGHAGQNSANVECWYATDTFPLHKQVRIEVGYLVRKLVQNTQGHVLMISDTSHAGNLSSKVLRNPQFVPPSTKFGDKRSLELIGASAVGRPAPRAALLDGLVEVLPALSKHHGFATSKMLYEALCENLPAQWRARYTPIRDVVVNGLPIFVILPEEHETMLTRQPRKPQSLLQRLWFGKTS